MKSYLFVGDAHGDLDFVERAARRAAQDGAEIIQVGDWGFIWPGANQVRALSRTLVLAGEIEARPPPTMRWVDGNHDEHPRLREACYRDADTDFMTYVAPRDRGVELAAGVIYQPRASTHVDEDGTRFLFVGGAPSIDRAFRVRGRSWWPEEIISEDEFERALAVEGPVHVLVTHDAAAFPPGFGPKGDPEFQTLSQRSMEMIAALVARHRPQLHVHGHWHHRYTRHDAGTTTEGLGCNFDWLDQATLLWSRDETS
ncbi:MAG: metallophosphoesterase family protein [Kofleriaceae bacterium]